ncbi:MAG TPA: hypothetical protein V6D00_02840 [Pantanalinema sp.]
MRRPKRFATPLLLGALSALGAIEGCANEATKLRPEPIMRLTLKMTGALETTNPNIRYYVILNTATLADSTPPAEAEALAATGLVPTSGQPAGPRAYGPLNRVKPLIGWDLPVFLSGPTSNPRDPRLTPEYTGTVPLFPVTWTDYYMLSSEMGSLRLTHGRHPKPVSSPRDILSDTENLQKGQDWFVERDSLIILIKLKSLLNGEQYVAPAEDQSPPGSIVTANFITSNTLGEIIDRWTLAADEPGVTLKTALNSQDQNQDFRPTVLFPQYKPSGVSEDSVNLSMYQSQIRQ